MLAIELYSQDAAVPSDKADVFAWSHEAYTPVKFTLTDK